MLNSRRRRNFLRVSVIYNENKYNKFAIGVAEGPKRTLLIEFKNLTNLTHERNKRTSDMIALVSRFAARCR